MRRPELSLAILDPLDPAARAAWLPQRGPLAHPSPGNLAPGSPGAGQHYDHVPEVAVADAEEQAACQKWEGDEQDDERTHRLVQHLHQVAYLVGQHFRRNGLVHEPLHGHPVVVVLAVAFSGGEMLVDATEHDQG